MKSARLFLLFLAVVVLTFPQAACNTVEGVGKDLTSAAQGVKDTINEQQGY
ncbi:MAG: entericidin EcnA/B family protein [Bdellovibrionales bacterium]